MTSLVRQRLAAQQLATRAFKEPAELVEWMGAVQAQEYLSSLWAVALRLKNAPTEADIERAIADGSIIRTHAFRGTWQLIAKDDVRWILSLVRTRVQQKAAGRHRELELDAKTLKNSAAALVKAMEKGGALTREEVARALTSARISPAGQRLPHILGHIELEGLICGGPRRGKQLTWKLLDTREDKRSSDEALAELTKRFFQSRGPATIDDFTWWTGLRVSDAKQGIDAAKSALISEKFDGREYWRSRSLKSKPPSPRAVLLPAFDEWLVGYRNRDAVLDPTRKGHLNAGGGIIGMCVVLDGTVVGTWRRTIERKRVRVDVKLFEKLPARDANEIDAAVQRYGEFLQLPVAR